MCIRDSTITSTSSNYQGDYNALDTPYTVLSGHRGIILATGRFFVDSGSTSQIAIAGEADIDRQLSLMKLRASDAYLSGFSNLNGLKIAETNIYRYADPLNLSVILGILTLWLCHTAAYQVAYYLSYKTNSFAPATVGTVKAEFELELLRSA